MWNTNRYLFHTPPNKEVWHMAEIYGGPGAGPLPIYAWGAQKWLGPCRHSPKNRCLRRQAINFTQLRRVRGLGDGPLGIEEWDTLACKTRPLSLPKQSLKTTTHCRNNWSQTNRVLNTAGQKSWYRQPRPGFELISQSSFRKTITITQRTPPIYLHVSIDLSLSMWVTRRVVKCLLSIIRFAWILPILFLRN